jgi:hypothetical protein
MCECIYVLLTDCLQCCCREIRRMLTFLIKLCLPEVYHKPYQWIRKHKYHRKIITKPNTLSRNETQEIFFSVSIFANVISWPKRTILDKEPFSNRSFFPSCISIITGNRTEDRFFRDCGPCFCNLHIERMKFGFVPFYRVSSHATEFTFTAARTQDFFWIVAVFL